MYRGGACMGEAGGGKVWEQRCGRGWSEGRESGAGRHGLGQGGSVGCPCMPVSLVHRHSLRMARHPGRPSLNNPSPLHLRPLSLPRPPGPLSTTPRPPAPATRLCP